MRKVVAFLAFLCCSNLVNAFPEIDLCPYVGADATWRHMGYKSGFGNGLFKKTVPQGNIYAGVQLTDYLAVEGGYEAIRKKSKTVILTDGDSGLGYVFEPDFTIPPPAAPLVAEAHTYKEELKGWHLSLLGILPYNSSLQFFGGIGISRKKVRLTDTYIWNNSDGFLPQSEVNDFRRTFVKRKSFLRLSAGVQKLLTECLGARVVVNWENTAKFGILSSQQVSVKKAKLANSLSGGIGFFIKF